MKQKQAISTLAVAFSVALVLAPPSDGALAQSYPARTVRWVVPYPQGGSPERFADIIREDIERWSKVVKAAGVSSEQ